MTTQYNRNVDLLKGIGIFLVVLGHSFYFSFTDYTNAIAFTALASIHMPLFFIISGYLAGVKNLSSKNLNWVPEYIRSKVQRLLLPLIFVPIVYALCMNANVEAAILDYTNSIVPSTMHSGYWFTLALFQVFLFFILFKVLLCIVLKLPQISSKGSSSILIEVFLILVVFCLVRYIISPQLLRVNERLYNTMSFSRVNDLIPYFFLGYLLSKKEQCFRFLKHPGIVLILACIHFLTFYDKVAYDRWRFNDIIILSGLAILYNVVTQIHLRNEKETISPLFIHLGKNSLAIYLIHYFLLPELPMVKEFLEQIDNPNRIFLTETTLATLNTIFVIAASLLVIKIIRLNKYLAFLLLGESLPKNNKQSVSLQESK